MFAYIISNDLQLKLLEMRHAEEMFKLSDQNRVHLREWLPWVDDTKSVEQTKEFIQLSLNFFADNNGFSSGIFYKEKIVGCIGLHSLIGEINRLLLAIGYLQISKEKAS
ncbi:putative ribosomal N-acetyltransferase YdaF [compost metagenome]